MSIEVLRKGKLTAQTPTSLIYDVEDKPALMVVERKDVIMDNDNHEPAVYQLDGIGEVLNRISCNVYGALNAAGIKTNFLQRLDDRNAIYYKTEPVGLEVIVRNYGTGSFAQRYNLPPGLNELRCPVCEFTLKDDKLGDPLLAEDAVVALGLLQGRNEVKEVRRVANDVNDVLRQAFGRCELNLIDFKIEFGRLPSGMLILTDGVTPETARIEDCKTGGRLDKGIFCDGNYNKIVEAYTEVDWRLQDLAFTKKHQNLEDGFGNSLDK